MTTTNRLIEVYRLLGCVLNNPAAFGLGHRAPTPLIDALTTSRSRLMEEMSEQKCRQEEEPSLEAELSQDADTKPCPEKKAS